MDERGVLERLEDALHRVFDRQHEACRELLQRSARVAERRRVREEAQRRDQVVELRLGLVRGWRHRSSRRTSLPPARCRARRGGRAAPASPSARRVRPSPGSAAPARRVALSLSATGAVAARRRRITRVRRRWRRVGGGACSARPRARSPRPDSVRASSPSCSTRAVGCLDALRACAQYTRTSVRIAPLRRSKNTLDSLALTRPGNAAHRLPLFLLTTRDRSQSVGSAASVRRKEVRGMDAQTDCSEISPGARSWVSASRSRS